MPQQRLAGLADDVTSSFKSVRPPSSREVRESDEVEPATFVTETNELVIGSRDAEPFGSVTSAVPLVIMTPPKSPETAEEVAAELGKDHLGVFRGLSLTDQRFPADFVVKHEVAGLRSAYAEHHSRPPPFSPTGEPAFTTFHCRMKVLMLFLSSCLANLARTLRDVADVRGLHLVQSRPGLYRLCGDVDTKRAEQMVDTSNQVSRLFF
jgi:hypothetical protein